VFIEGYYDLIVLVESQTNKDLSSLYFVGLPHFGHSSVPIRALLVSYFSTAFSGKYTDTLKYLYNLNKKMKSVRLIFPSLPYLIPKFIRRWIFKIGGFIFRDLRDRSRADDSELKSKQKSKRRFLSSENI